VGNFQRLFLQYGQVYYDPGIEKIKLSFRSRVEVSPDFSTSRISAWSRPIADVSPVDVAF
jgi:hypothetical protein